MFSPLIIDIPTDRGKVSAFASGGGPNLLVALHASGAGPKSLTEMMSWAVARGWRMRAPVLTPLPDEDPITTYARAAETCLGPGPIERRVLFGHSMGGLACVVAAAGRTDLDAVVLYDPIVPFLLDQDDPEERALRDWNAEIVSDLSQGLAARDAEAAVARFVDTWNEVAWAELPDHMRRRLVFSADMLARETASIEATTLPREKLAETDTPVLILTGQRSPVMAIMMADRLAALLPHASRATILGAGHMGPALRPEQVVDALEQFMAPAEMPTTG